VASHNKNTVRYYILIVITLAFLFFSNDFGLLDVQKTAIVLAVGVDREDDSFILTSQIAIPQDSKQGKATETVQLVSRGKTIADAFEEINAKTGWYPKLVFCNLILLGNKTAERNVFDALDFFLRDEYLSDNCLVATCDVAAKDLLNTSALVDPSASVAIQKVLSAHAERVGTVLPSTLREFSIGYFSESSSGFLPVLKTRPQQEQIGSDTSSSGGSSGSSSSGSSEQNSEQSGSNSESSQDSSSQGGQGGGQDSQKSQNKQGNDKPVFSAGETALFSEGRRVGTLTEEESFAFGAVKNKLRLATYSVEQANKISTLTLKRNSPKIRFTVGKNERPCLKITVTVSAGMLDYSASQRLEDIADVGDVPRGVFAQAEKKLAAEITRVFEKSRACGCDLFGIVEYLQKYEKEHFHALKDTALDGTILDVEVKFQNIR